MMHIVTSCGLLESVLYIMIKAYRTSPMCYAQSDRVSIVLGLVGNRWLLTLMGGKLSSKIICFLGKTLDLVLLT